MKNISITEVNFWYWLVRRMPKKLIYFSFLHVMVRSEEHKTTPISEIYGMDAIKQYIGES